MNEKKDHFAYKAKTYEQDVKRSRNVENIADAIKKEIFFTKQEHIMDFGSGTGLLTEQIAPYVKKITAIDVSASMIEVLKEKKLECEVDVLNIDITKELREFTFDTIISSMTIHHINDIKDIFTKFYNMLKVGGSIAISDLETEDGSFHKVDTGVFHFGFNKDEFLDIAKSVGFKNLKIKTVSVASKPNGDFPIFLLTANK